MKQTAVELLKKELDAEMKLGTKMVVNWDMYLEMEKQQIIDAYNNGDLRSADLYYTSTYGSKGSDETLKDYHIVDTNEMVDISDEKPMRFHCVPKEISDEEIEDVAWEKFITDSGKFGFISGAKWYREQLKNQTK